jgi:hypothetical protein
MSEHLRFAAFLAQGNTWMNPNAIADDAKELILAHRKLARLADPMGLETAAIVVRLASLLSPHGFGGSWSVDHGLRLVVHGAYWPVPL